MKKNVLKRKKIVLTLVVLCFIIISVMPNIVSISHVMGGQGWWWEHDDTPPDPVELSWPTDGYIDQRPRPIFWWSWAYDPPPSSGLSHFEIEIDDDADFSSPIKALFTEDFEDVEAATERWRTHGSGVWMVENGEYNQTVYDPQGWDNFAYVRWFRGKDLVMTAKVTLESSAADDNRAGILVHNPNGANYNKWALVYHDGGGYFDLGLALLEEVMNETTGDPIPGLWGDRDTGFQMELHAPYWFKMQVIGNEVWGKAWKAGEPEPGWMVHDLFGEKYSENIENRAIGLDSGTYKARFDDVKVMPIDFLLDNDFNTRDVSAWQEAVGSWVVENGEYVGSDPEGHAATYAGDQSWTDYRVSVRAKPITSDWIIILRARQQDWKNNYCILTHEHGFHVYKVVNAEWTILQSVPIEIPLNEWHSLAIECLGNHLRFYYNGELQYFVIDGQFPSGGIALVADSPVELRPLPVTVHFDDVKVVKLLQDNHFQPEDQLYAGKYWWRVRQVDYAGNVGAWSEPWSFTSTNPAIGYGYGSEPLLGVGPDGTVHVAWSDSNVNIFYRRHIRGIGWTTVERFDTIDEVSLGGPVCTSLVVGPDGTGFVAFHGRAPSVHYGDFVGILAYVPGTGLTWVGGAGPDDSRWASLAVGSDGTLHIAWVYSEFLEAPPITPPDQGMFYVSLTGWTGTGFTGSTARETISTGGGSPSLGVGPDGSVHITWVEGAILYKRQVPDTGWTATQTVTTAGSAPSLAVGPDGSVHITWEEDGIKYRRYKPSVGWTATQTVSTAGSAPSLAVGPDGSVHITWNMDKDIFYKKMITWEYTYDVIDTVDIGNPTSESGHPIWGWGPIRDWRGDWRVTWHPGEGTITWDRGAVVNLYKSRGSISKCLSLRALDGPHQSFDVYGKVSWGKGWTEYQKLYSYDSTREVEWVTHRIRMPKGWRYARKVRVWIVATDDPWRGFEKYGQLAVDWVKLSGLIKVSK